MDWSQKSCESRLSSKVVWKSARNKIFAIQAGDESGQAHKEDRIHRGRRRARGEDCLPAGEGTRSSPAAMFSICKFFSLYRATAVETLLGFYASCLCFLKHDGDAGLNLGV